MRQFRILGPEIIYKIEDRKLCVEKLREMDVKEIGECSKHHSIDNYKDDEHKVISR